MHLDVDKVLSSTDISQACGVVPAQLNYLDHQGRDREPDGAPVVVARVDLACHVTRR